MANKKFLKLSIVNKCNRLKTLYSNSRHTGKTQLMLYNCLDDTIVIVNDTSKDKEIKSILKQHNIDCTISTLDNIENCDKIKNRLLHVDHYVIEKLVDDVLELLEKIDV